jgi:esterase/lipase
MHAYRTRFAKDILTEFLPPAQPGRRTRAIIFCDGMPGMPGKKNLLEFYSKKGFWVFSPRYRGTWESGGKFLRRSPEEDIREVMDGLSKGFTELFAGKRFTVKPDAIYLFASSFGGPAGILLSKDPRVTKVVAFSPVTDQRYFITRGETHDWAKRFTREAFGEAYRFSDRDWEKQKNGKFYNPMTNLDKVDGRKILILQAKDDESVPYPPVKKFAETSGAALWLMAKGGHCDSAWYTKPRFYARIAKFLRAKAISHDTPSQRSSRPALHER